MEILNSLKEEISLLNKKIKDLKELIVFLNKKVDKERYSKEIKKRKLEIKSYDNEINTINEWIQYIEKKRIKLYSLYYKGDIFKYKLKLECVNNICILDELHELESKDIIKILEDKNLKLSVDLFIKTQINYDIDNITDNIIDFVMKYHVIGKYVNDRQIYNLNITKVISENKNETGFYIIIYYIT